MQRAATIIDIAAVWLIVNCDYVGAERAKQLRPELAGGAVCAVQDEFQPRKFRARNHPAAQVGQIFLIERSISRNSNSMRRAVLSLVIVNLDFEVLSDFVRKFHPGSG